MDENLGLSPLLSKKWHDRMVVSHDRAVKIARVVERAANGESLSGACKAVGVDYLEFRRWVDRLSAGKTFGKRRAYQGYLEYAEATPEERFYADVFQVGLGEAENYMPGKAEQTIRMAVNLLEDEREKYILLENYLNNRTLEELCDELRITRQRVHQIKSLALKRMRHPKITNVLLNGVSVYEDARASLEDAKKEALRQLEESLERSDEVIQEAKRVAEIADERGTAYESVKNLSLGTRTINCLNRAGIRTVGDLVGQDLYKLTKLRNFGVSCLNDLSTALINRGWIQPVERKNGDIEFQWIRSE